MIEVFAYQTGPNTLKYAILYKGECLYMVLAIGDKLHFTCPGAKLNGGLGTVRMYWAKISYGDFQSRLLTHIKKTHMSQIYFSPGTDPVKRAVAHPVLGEMLAEVKGL